MASLMTKSSKSLPNSFLETLLPLCFFWRGHFGTSHLRALCALVQDPRDTTQRVHWGYYKLEAYKWSEILRLSLFGAIWSSHKLVHDAGYWDNCPKCKFFVRRIGLTDEVGQVVAFANFAKGSRSPRRTSCLSVDTPSKLGGASRNGLAWWILTSPNGAISTRWRSGGAQSRGLVPSLQGSLISTHARRLRDLKRA
jgi:hypothetical protein